MDNTNIISTSDAEKVMKQRDMKKVAKKQLVIKIISLVLVYAFLLSVAVVVIFPFYFMLISSVKTPQEFEQVKPSLLPWQFNKGDNWADAIDWENYAQVFIYKPYELDDNGEPIRDAAGKFIETGYDLKLELGQLMSNTVFVGVVSTILSLIITILTAFAFARLEFKGKNALFAALLATMMIPGELFTITNYGTVSAFGSKDFLGGALSWMGKNTFGVLIVPFLVSVFYIYLLKQNFQQVPNELYLAAKVDGTKDLKYLWKVMIPLALPTIISITILKMMGSWNSYMWPKLVANDETHRLITNGLRDAFNNGAGKTPDIPRQMAAVAVVSLPLFLVFIFLRKYIMKGVSRSGIKG